MNHDLRPQELGEYLMRHSHSTNTTNTQITVVTCSDPRVAEVAKNINAKFVRIPGVVVDPTWSGFSFLREATSRTLVFLGHSQCLAHKGSNRNARNQVQWTRQAFRHNYGSTHDYVVGMIEVGTLSVTFLDPFGGIGNAGLEELTAINHGHTTTARSTSILHAPVGVLAVSLDGALDGVREKDLMYVIDDIGQPQRDLEKQVQTIGCIVMTNAKAMGSTPHLLVAGTDRFTAAQLHAVKLDALRVLSGLEGGDRFTSEIVVRDDHGGFSVISTSISQIELSRRYEET